MERSLIQDLAYFFEVGGYVMPPLMAVTVLLWFAIGYRFAALKRGSVRSVRRLIRRISKEKQLRTPKGLLDRAVLRGLAIVRRNPTHLRRHLDDAFADLERTTRRYNTLIFTIVAVAPLMGLLGTVVGMIETFDSLGDMSLFAQSGGIAGGISQALFTTQMGLAVAIPGLIIGGMLDRKASMIRHDLAQIKDLLCAAPAPEAIR
ncbi:MAG: MotA/TolQ/ExbB proton channel family protein [Gammaproteobacteria bacterium]|nr:MotA/TolQ/ExbB proton channel family protein [Gammaproteobacteria bacterium]